MTVCSIVECESKTRSRGYCGKHYKRWSRHGDPNCVAPGYENCGADAATRLAAYTEQRGSCVVYTRGKPSRSGHRLIAHRGKDRGVHRVAWELANGPIPVGMCVLHHCDVPSCVNVDHLFLGTLADNNHDRDRKGRQVAAKGSKHVRAKLTEWEVQQIRERHGAGEAILALSREFSVSQRAVQLAVRGETWQHVRTPALMPTAELVEKYRPKLAEDDIRAIRAAVASGATITATAKRFGVARTAIANIVHRRSWKSVA
ncbi:MAG: HNH endonuclease [Candidatus Dormibacteria bacterium]